MSKKVLTTTFLFFVLFNLSGQWGPPSYEATWDARWITVPEINGVEPGLYLFRKEINLASSPDTFPIHVTGDSRYKLYVNEQLVSVGPALGDLENWNYATLDLASFLQAGTNVIAARVWNEGDLRPVNQFTYHTAFLIQGASPNAAILNTDSTWLCIEDKSYQPIPQIVRGYYAAGAGEVIDFQKAIGDWTSAGTDLSNWREAEMLNVRGWVGFGTDFNKGWRLQPSILPEMERKPERLQKTRWAQGVQVPEEFPAQSRSFRIEANSDATILLDQTYLTNAYFTLAFSGGKGSRITINYAEGLYDEEYSKGNRNEVANKQMIGRSDTLYSNGKNEQRFTSLDYRTYRYIQVSIRTLDEPLRIDDAYGTFTGYPFERVATLKTTDPDIPQIFDVGWRTARLCAVEIYMDCPYYERLQYVGDTRIQQMISYFNSGDDRLSKNMINLMDQSRRKDGYTLSRYPDILDQVIPTYSLWYIPVVQDYMLYNADMDFVKEKLMSTRQILDYFISYQMPDGSLKQVPGWNFSDWVTGWTSGIAPIGADGSSAMMDLHLLLAFQSAHELEKAQGIPGYANLYQDLAQQLSTTIKAKYWDPTRGLFADTPEKDEFSQHTNSLAILGGLATADQKNAIAQQLLTDETLHQASIYFKYYLHLALVEAGLGDQYLDWLDIWRENIQMGMTTWGERWRVRDTRSDCHAWGSSPNIEFYRVLLGIQSVSAGFQDVLIQPHLGEIEEIGGSMPHPKGMISANYVKTRKGLKVLIVLPESISGSFKWNGNVYALNGGTNEFLAK